MSDSTTEIKKPKKDNETSNISEETSVNETITSDRGPMRKSSKFCSILWIEFCVNHNAACKFSTVSLLNWNIAST